MIDIRAKELADSNVKLANAINRFCDLLEGRSKPPPVLVEAALEPVMCKDCGLFYSLKYGHYCPCDTSPEER